MSTVVRLVKHVTCQKLSKPGLWLKWGGRLIKIGTPVCAEHTIVSNTSNKKWPCNSDILWPVLEMDMLNDYDTPIHVCRHMIEAGD